MCPRDSLLLLSTTFVLSASVSPLHPTNLPLALCPMSAHHHNTLCSPLACAFRYSFCQSASTLTLSPHATPLSAPRRVCPRGLVPNPTSPPCDVSDCLTSRCCRFLVSGHTNLYHFVTHDSLVLGHRALDVSISRASVSLSFHFSLYLHLLPFIPIHVLRFWIGCSVRTFIFRFESLGHPLTFSPIVSLACM